ncbi:MAG TPA: ABC transporter ATP-binding protein [candidate division Zixibacteria bacterium]|nr:ABC transporter ATP-binding protein [candidate division Zixibacteria bacterium]
MSLIEIKNLIFGYNPNQIPLFNNFSLTLPKGEIISIIGRNGAGKTTLAKLMIGMLRPQKGNILIDNEATNKKTIAEIAEKIGYVFQNPNIMLFTNTVEKELELSLLRLNIPKEEAEKRIQEMLDFFNLEIYRKVHPRLLSRGEKQKLALAIVLIQNPQAIILDEPFSGIDIKQKIQIRDYIFKLKEQKRLVLIITHDLDAVLEYSDRVISMDFGNIIFNGQTEQFFYNPTNLQKVNLTETYMLSMFYSLRKEGLPENILKRKEIISYFKHKFS